MDANLLSQLNAPKPKNKEDSGNSDNPVVGHLSASVDNGAKLYAKALTSMFSGVIGDFGSASVTSGFDSEGIAGKSLPSILPDAQGGPFQWAAEIGKILLKNGATLTNHTEGVDGSDVTHKNEPAKHGDAHVEPNHGLPGMGAGNSSAGPSFDH